MSSAKSDNENQFAVTLILQIDSYIKSAVKGATRPDIDQITFASMLSMSGLAVSTARKDTVKNWA